MMVLGMVLAGYGIAKKRSWVTIPSAGVSAIVGLGLILSLFVLLKLPPAGAVAATADTLPDFTLPNQDGRAVTLSSYRGKGPVLVVFYRGHW
jgi:cytochrome oxidase Cu insertion factor (SCO1/SenC/PrrC family)